MKVDHQARAKAKMDAMRHPDWHKYSGWPPEDAEPATEDKPRRRQRGEDKPAEDSGE